MTAYSQQMISYSIKNNKSGVEIFKIAQQTILRPN
jgi:hypothetical protein